MVYPGPNLNQPIVDSKGKTGKSLRLWIDDVTRRQLFRSVGSPEGQIEAFEDALCVDTATEGLYYKKFAEVGGNKSNGWVKTT